MAKSVSIAPPNGLIFISDASGGDTPEFVPHELVLSTDTAISVCCLPDMDGETKITLGLALETELPGAPVFDGVLKTLTNIVLVSTCEHETIIKAEVPSRETRVRIWTNRTQEPDEITIALGD